VHIIVTAAINHKLCSCLEGRFPVNLKPKIKVGHTVLDSLFSNRYVSGYLIMQRTQIPSVLGIYEMLLL